MNLAEKILLTLVGLFSVAAIVFVLNQQGIFNGPKNFAECSNTEGSRILETYPPQCLWHSKIFVEELEQEPAVADGSLVENSDSRDPEEAGATNIYSNEDFGLTFELPEDYVLWEEGIDNAGEQLTVHIVHKNEDSRSINVRIINEPFDAAQIKGFYGGAPAGGVKQLSVSDRDWYQFVDGDAGCGASVYQTSWESKTLKLEFGDCEDGTDRVRLFMDNELAEKVLATVTFR